jgi:hypothetical protein
VAVKAEKKKFLLRLDAQLYAAIERWAADELRSANAQIEFLLTEAARRAGRLKPGGAPPTGAEPSPGTDEGSRDD